MRSKVYFSETITPECVKELYEKVGVTLPGNVAIKLHSGEAGTRTLSVPTSGVP